MKKVLLLFSMLAFYACDPDPLKLTLINDTEAPIYFRLETYTSPYVDAQLELLYPYDTVKPSFVKGGTQAQARELWAYKINKKGIDSSLHIFIFRPNPITENREYVKLTDEIVKQWEHVCLSYTVKELDSLNWTVVYSGQNK